MRQFSRQPRLGARTAVSSLAAMAAIAAAATFAAPAMAAGTTVTAAWATVSATAPGSTTAVAVPEIGLNAPTTITYTIANGSTTDTIDDVSFTDTLPSSVHAVLFEGSGVAGTYSGCGSAYDDSANTAGKATITVTGVSVAPSSKCTVSFGVVGSKAGIGTDSISTVDYTDETTSTSGTITPTDAPTLTVLENPTVTFTVPHAKGTSSYAYGQIVAANYVAVEADSQYADPQAFGFDNDGAEVDDGGYLDTLEAGRNALNVTAINVGFGEASPSPSAAYTVRPFVVRDLRSSKSRARALSYAVSLPIAGKLTTRVLDGHRVVATQTKKVTKAGTVKPSLKLNATGRRLLAKSHGKRLKVKVRITFTPSSNAVSTSNYFASFDPRPTTVVKAGVKLK